MLEAKDPPAFHAELGRRSAHPGSSVEVMMAGSHAGASKGDAGKGVPKDLVTPVDLIDKPT